MGCDAYDVVCTAIIEKMLGEIDNAPRISCRPPDLLDVGWVLCIKSDTSRRGLGVLMPAASEVQRSNGRDRGGPVRSRKSQTDSNILKRSVSSRKTIDDL